MADQLGVEVAILLTRDGVPPPTDLYGVVLGGKRDPLGLEGIVYWIQTERRKQSFEVGNHVLCEFKHKRMVVRLDAAVGDLGATVGRRLIKRPRRDEPVRWRER